MRLGEWGMERVQGTCAPALCYAVEYGRDLHGKVAVTYDL
jgi:hypothetical protein